MTNVNFRDACSSTIEIIHNFHDWIIMIIISISVLTIRTLIIICRNHYSYREFKDIQGLESFWTIVPTLILAAIAIPSLKLLYIVDRRDAHGLSVKAVGRQWYWQYDYPMLPTFDSYMTRREYRLLDVDNRLQAHIGCAFQILITAADVLHSWTLPAMGIKADAVPGRVNKVLLDSKRAGVFYGQCSEICGRNHRFMPISIECSIFNYRYTLKVLADKS